MTDRLYVLAFDHRRSLMTSFFGVHGEPTSDDVRAARDAKQVIWEGLLRAIDDGVDGPGDGCRGGEHQQDRRAVANRVVERPGGVAADRRSQRDRACRGQGRGDGERHEQAQARGRKGEDDDRRDAEAEGAALALRQQPAREERRREADRERPHPDGS